MFTYRAFDNLSDGEIKLVLASADQPDEEQGILPRYGFAIVHSITGEELGQIYFAVDTTRRQFLRGHLSYGVSPEHNGHSYAAKACMLVKEVALAHGFKRLFIGSKYDNIASRKTIEKLGARRIVRADVPDDGVIQYLHEERIDMFVWDIT